MYSKQLQAGKLFGKKVTKQLETDNEAASHCTVEAYDETNKQALVGEPHDR
jgi:hypothetical protein